MSREWGYTFLPRSPQSLVTQMMGCVGYRDWGMEISFRDDFIGVGFF